MRYLIAALVTVLWPLASSAATITLSFSGGIGTGGGGPFSLNPGPYSSLVSLSSPAFGTITFETGVADSDSRVGFGDYFQSPPNFVVDVWIGGLHIAANQGEVRIVDNQILGTRFLDAFFVLSETNTPGPGSNFQLYLTDASASVFTNDSLPTVFPPIGAFDPPPGQQLGDFALGAFTNTLGVFIPIYANSVVAVPEPTIAWTMCAALMSVVLRRRASIS